MKNECTFERLAFISLGFGRGAQVWEISLLQVEFILRRKRRRWAYSMFFIWYADGTPPRQRSGIASQQRLRPRRFDSTVLNLGLNLFHAYF